MLRADAYDTLENRSDLSRHGKLLLRIIGGSLAKAIGGMSPILRLKCAVDVGRRRLSRLSQRWRWVLTTQGGLQTQCSTEKSADISGEPSGTVCVEQLAVPHKTAKKRAAVKRVRRGLKALKRAHRQRVTNIVDWRRTVRPAILRRAKTATIGLDWSPALFATLLDELGENDGLEWLVGPIRKDLDIVAYPRVIALALVLRHSWQPDDLHWILESLQLIDGSNIGR
jgi:hypothetical protein